MGHLHERTGVIERLTPKGAILDDTLILYSKWFKGDRLKESHVGNQVTVLLDDTGERCFIKKLVKIGPKVEPVESTVESNSRPSPRVDTFDTETAARIARSVAVKAAINLARHGIPIEKIAVDAATLERFLLTGEFSLEGASVEDSVPPAPEETAPVESSKPSGASEKTAKPKGGTRRKAGGRSSSRFTKVEGRRVNELFNDAKRAKVVVEWGDFEFLCREALEGAYTSAYTIKPEEFLKVDQHIKALIQDQAQAA